MEPTPSDDEDARARGALSRRGVLVATAAAATLAGAGVAWWRSQRPDVDPIVEPVDGLWSLRWDAPEGGTVKMRSFRGRPLLLNFWATWCPPCIDELPLINAFYRENKANGMQVIGLAVDKLTSVQHFLQKMPLDFPIGMAGLSGADLGRNLGNLAGGLPFSVLFDSAGTIAQRKMGRLNAEDLRAWAQLK